LLNEAQRPLVFEVRGPRSPSDNEWAVLRAPWELLAPPEGGGFLAADAVDRFCVVRRLGPPGERPKLDRFRLGLAFMASSPRGQHELDFEAEEAAILSAVGETQIDLLVEDTGNPKQLAARLAEAGGMPVVHLSCHGLNAWRPRPEAAPVPVLMMEDDTGGDRPTESGDLAWLLGTGQHTGPRLVFVSACLTATGADAKGHLPPGEDDKGGASGAGGKALVSHSLATALVAAGVPAVIGWDGSVYDRAATVFASELYPRLGMREDLALAVGDARRVLLNSDDPVIRSEWHMARVWLGRAGGGPVVEGRDKRSLVSATHATQVFLDRKQQVPVAAPEMFVGRRPELQQALRALRSGRKAGVLLHGQGRLGKSSLAARLADRYPEYAVAVVYGQYGALAILDTIADVVEVNPDARELIASHRGQVRDNPEAIQGVLTDLLAGPCSQRGDGGKQPLLLILDDLEQILVANLSGPRKVDPAHAGVLSGVLRAFNPARTESRLLITSRFTFALGGLEDRLEDVPLRPMSPVAQRKLQRRELAFAPEELPAERATLAERAVAVARGNPGLQDLAVRRLAYAGQVSDERAEAAVAGIEDYLRQGDLPADEETREFLENLALTALLAEAGESGVALLRATTLFTLPVPEPVITTLADQVGGSPTRLRGLGLLAPYPDLHDPARTALAADPLAAGRVPPLTDSEMEALAAIMTGPLFHAWGGKAAQPLRGLDLDLELAGLGLLADDPDVTAACAAKAVLALRTGPAVDAFTLGRNAIALLDRHGRAVPLFLLRQSADAALTSGDGAAGEALLDRAVHQARAADQDEDGSLDRARVLVQQARRLVTRGEPAEGRHLFDQALQLFTTAGSEGEAAVVWGEIADITYQRGDYDEALRIHHEIQLPVYERLGDTRSAALTWGRIADITYRRGDYDEAAKLQHMRLEVNRQLGDLDGIASANWDLAQIDLTRKDYGSAFSRLAESWQILSKLQRPDGIAVVGERLGQLLAAAGQPGQARQVLTAAQAAAAKIGMTDQVQRISDLIGQLPPEEDT
jgi:tetratricopeptide (TPR) repeat protein